MKYEEDRNIQNNQLDARQSDQIRIQQKKEPCIETPSVGQKKEKSAGTQSSKTHNSRKKRKTVQPNSKIAILDYDLLMQYFSTLCDGADGERRDSNAPDGADGEWRGYNAPDGAGCKVKIELDEGWGEAETEAAAGTANDDEDGGGYDNEIDGIDGCRGDDAVFLRDDQSQNHMGLHDSKFSHDQNGTHVQDSTHDQNNSHGEKIFPDPKPVTSSDAAFEAYLTFINGPEPAMKRSRMLQYSFPVFEDCSLQELAERRLRNILHCMDSDAREFTGADGEADNAGVSSCSKSDASGSYDTDDALRSGIVRFDGFDYAYADVKVKKLFISGRCCSPEAKEFRRRFILAACRDGIALKYIAGFLSVSHETVRRISHT